MTAAGISALTLLQAPAFAQQLMLAIWAVLYLALAAMVNKKWASHTTDKQHDPA